MTFKDQKIKYTELNEWAQSTTFNVQTMCKAKEKKGQRPLPIQ